MEDEAVALTLSLAALSSPSICFAKVSLTHSLTGADLGERGAGPGLGEFRLVWFLLNLLHMSSFSWRS